MDFATALAAELRAQRAGESMSRRELAQCASIPERTLTRIETGSVSPKAEQVALIVWALGLTLPGFYLMVEARMARTAVRTISGQQTAD